MPPQVRPGLAGVLQACALPNPTLCLLKQTHLGGRPEQTSGEGLPPILLYRDDQPQKRFEARSHCFHMEILTCWINVFNFAVFFFYPGVSFLAGAGRGGGQADKGKLKSGLWVQRLSGWNNWFL